MLALCPRLPRQGSPLLLRVACRPRSRKLALRAATVATVPGGSWDSLTVRSAIGTEDGQEVLAAIGSSRLAFSRGLSRSYSAMCRSRH